jgi:XRE family aerobic/anaerobic benzoate catabolism transcriptional regulator
MELLVGHRIRELRLAQRMTQQVLAEKAGLNDKHLGVIERSGRDLALSTMRRIADALDVPVAVLLGEPDKDDQVIIKRLVREVLSAQEPETIRKLRVFLEQILLR